MDFWIILIINKSQPCNVHTPLGRKRKLLARLMSIYWKYVWEYVHVKQNTPVTMKYFYLAVCFNLAVVFRDQVNDIRAQRSRINSEYLVLPLSTFFVEDGTITWNLQLSPLRLSSSRLSHSADQFSASWCQRRKRGERLSVGQHSVHFSASTVCLDTLIQLHFNVPATGAWFLEAVNWMLVTIRHFFS